MVESVCLLPKAEKEIDQLEEVSARYRNERKAARTQLKTTEAECNGYGTLEESQGFILILHAECTEPVFIGRARRDTS